ncbi:Stage II sporulation protein M [Clostridium liquoris]|jgi:stage II sporulation protein M|uniref:Stage II sporulation protein M n=1 Tax=Clostridium liquoris TaxID=1289519 RepID=A0A2T0B4L9_9CLOT|nr:stage II sporulation protein M [Clostridium liquoris]PRR78812.1 Stage II sporulation protein M [Clostridium liquoris]
MSKKTLIGNFNEHIQDNFWLYIISLLCIFTGIVLGIYKVKYLGDTYRNDLLSYINSFMDYMKNKNVNYNTVLMTTIKNNIPFIAIIWFLGMTMIGIPIILIIDLIKGYTLGFTISIMINSIGTKGLWIAMLGVIPQNIVYIPCLLLSSVLAMEFSLNFLRERMGKRFSNGIWMRILSYSLSFLFIVVIMSLGFILEAYGTPNVLKIVM